MARRYRRLARAASGDQACPIPSPTIAPNTNSNSRWTACARSRRISWKATRSSSRTRWCPRSSKGRGVGSKLIRGALDAARDRGLKVVPQCPFVKAYIERHAEYRDLLGLAQITTLAREGGNATGITKWRGSDRLAKCAGETCAPLAMALELAEPRGDPRDTPAHAPCARARYRPRRRTGLARLRHVGREQRTERRFGRDVDRLAGADIHHQRQRPTAGIAAERIEERCCRRTESRRRRRPTRRSAKRSVAVPDRLGRPARNSVADATSDRRCACSNARHRYRSGRSRSMGAAHQRADRDARRVMRDAVVVADPKRPMPGAETIRSLRRVAVHA